MPPWAPWRALSVVLILAWARCPAGLSCPHPCSCYVPSEVHCTFRSLVSVPAGISQHVERINLGFNSIQVLSETSFAGLSKLELLMLHGNNIPSIPDGALRDLRSLQVFKFSYNKLRVITAHTLQGLQALLRLHMDHNKLEFIHPQAFKGLTSLRLVQLEGNALQQLHPATFSTFSFLDHFGLSNIRHLYLADNDLRTLPRGVFVNMPLLENLYLQGNPWVCDCDLSWFLEWERKSKGVLKCKKDKAYEGGQGCPACSGPRKLQKQELHKLDGIRCMRPSIESPLRANSTGSEEEEDQEDGVDGQLSPEAFQSPPWNVSLNMTDEHGNTVRLVCNIQKPTAVHKLQLNQTDAQDVDVNATVALDFECPMTRERYEKLWKLIAYYSEVPVKLRRENMGSRDPAAGAQYRQDDVADALYYTGVRARVSAHPEWVLQPAIALQLNRRQSTARTVLLSYYSDFSLTVSGRQAERARSRSWVMIEPSAAAGRAQTVLEGAPCQLSCNVKASESPSIVWVLPDGSVLRAPTEDRDGRFSLLTSGRLQIQATQRSDSGLYQCITQVRDETDRMVHRVLVQPTATAPPGTQTVTLQKHPGDPVVLPCDALSIPEAQLSWVLPNKRLIHGLANTSHAFVLANGTLSIPKAQASDTGDYQCVAVNQQGADHFTVHVAVSKHGPGRSSKRGRRPGAKTLPRLRGDVVDYEGGSGVGEEADTSRRVLPPKDQERVLTTKGGAKPKKGHRKLKPWKNAEKEPESNVAEGRRVFESRRRMKMASKQINPEHWADILARVRGRNLSKGTEGPESLKATPSPSARREVTPILPVVAPPWTPLVHATAGADEFSADVSLLGEEEHALPTVSWTRMRVEHSHAGVLLAEVRATSTDLEELIDTEFSETTEPPKLNTLHSPWVTGTTEISDVPSAPSAPQPVDAVSEEPTRDQIPTERVSTGDPGLVPDHRPPLDATSSAESDPRPSVYPGLEPEVQTMEEPAPRHWTPTPISSGVGSGTFEPFGGSVVGESGLPEQGRRQEDTQHPRLGKHFSTEGSPRMGKGTEKNPEVLRDVPERDPAVSRRRKSKHKGTVSPTFLGSTEGGKTHISPFQRPGKDTVGSLPDKDVTPAPGTLPTHKATEPPAPTSRPSRKRPNGRRRLRPHRFQQRHKQTPPPTSAPTESLSTRLTPGPGAQTPKQVESVLVPTSSVDSRVGVPLQVEMEKHAEPVTKGTPRRKQGKRPNQHQYSTSSTSSLAALSQPSPSSENKRPDATTSRPETVLGSTPVSPRTGDPRETTSLGHHTTDTTRTQLPPTMFRETIPVTYTPAPDEKEMENYSVTIVRDSHTDRFVPGESVLHVTSPSGTETSALGEFTKEFPPSRTAGTEGWTPRNAGQPGKLQTGAPVSGSPKTLPDTSPFLKESEDPMSPAEMSPSVGVLTQFHMEDVISSTLPSRTKIQSSSSQAETTLRGQGYPETPHSEIEPRNQVSTPTRVEESSSLSPSTTLGASVQTTARPTQLTSRASPPSTDSKENVFLNYVGIPETETSPVDHEDTPHTWTKKEFSTLPPKEGAFKLTPQLEFGKDAFDERTRNVLPRGPDNHHQDVRVQVLHQPARVSAQPTPPGRTTRPPPMATQSSHRHLVTFQPPRHLTNKPGITAYPSRVFPENKHLMTPKLSGPTTPVVPWRSPKPTKFTDQGTGQLNANSNVFGNNNIPELRDPVDKLPNSRPPHSSNGGVRVSFPDLVVTLKPPTATSAALLVRERKVSAGPYNKIHSQSIIHVDFGPPAPPLSHHPRTLSPPSTKVQNIPLAYPTWSSIRLETSPGHPSRSYHQSGSKLPSAGGPPASKFWTLGEKPQIITKSPQAVSVTAETDAVLPCEATGKPKPFVTWTKVSTGALLTPNSRVQRFEVLKNGTFVIRKVQMQDRGQYMCTAKNLHGVDRMVVLLSVATHQPQILASHYKDVTVYLGDTIAMECLAKGTPAPQISWIFPDRRVWQTVSPVEGRVTLHENRTLSIKEASFADRGVYKCVASNAAGADSLAIRLHVAALPPVIQQEKLENISLPPGLSIHVHCTAKAAPLPSVRWVLADGTHIRPSQFLHGKLFVFPNGTLYIRNLAPEDSGRYECVAANLVGSARRTVQLSVRRAAANARITGSSPHRTDVRYGATLRLDCSASGDPWPRVLWRLPSKRMIDALFSFDTRVKVFANGTLVVKSVTDKDAGDYLCVARNKIGDDFVVLKVNVVMKPAKIERREENDHKVLYGGDLKVDCVASGLPDPEISWSLPDGSLVNSFVQSDDSGGRAKRYVVFNNGTLYFNDVGLREEGDYTCVAENQVGKDEMRVRVKVLAEPAAIRNKTYSVVRVPYGDVIAVACEAQGDPTPRVTWLSPTHRLIPRSSDKYHIYPDGTLLIQRAQRADSGNYTCVVRNGAGEDRKVVWVHVHVQPPKINGNPDAITTVREVASGGSRKLIDCRAEGVPAPKVLWAFPDGVVLPAPYYGNRVTIHRNGTLDIKSLRKSDSIQLACIGRNEGGEARLIVQLTVLEPMEKPVFHDPVSEKITATAGHTISVNCSAAGSPRPGLLWVLPNGTELRSGQQLHRFYHKADGKLHISGLAPGDAGAYRCVARNAAGHTERLVSLKVGLKPEASKPAHNLVSIINGETLRLHCLPPGGRPEGVSWTLPSGMALEGPQTRGRFSLWENGTLTVRDASVFDRGTYVCQVDTAEHGPAVRNFPVIVIAYPPRITTEPTPVIYTRPGNNVKMNCLAVGIPKAQITWELPDRSHLTAGGTQARLYGNRFLHPQGSLTIQQVTHRDAGFYKCSAKNLLGTDTKTTYVHVY